jgi:hypothetical protein
LFLKRWPLRLVDQTSNREGCPPKLQHRRARPGSIRSRILNSRALDFCREARMLSDIVKRRSIRAPRVA